MSEYRNPATYNSLEPFDVIRRDIYSPGELELLAHSGILPGALGTTTWRDVLLGPDNQPSAWQPVENVMLVKQKNDAWCVTVGIRTEDFNEYGQQQTHAGFISLPTARMTSREALASYRQAVPSIAHAYAQRLSSLHSFNSATLAILKPQPSQFLTAPTRRLFETKLQISPAMLEAHAWPNALVSVEMGISEVDGGLQPVIMHTRVVQCPEDMQLAGEKNEHYRQLSWTPLEDFVANVENRSVTGLLPDLDPGHIDNLLICTGGVCVAAGAKVIAGLGDSLLW